MFRLYLLLALVLSLLWLTPRPPRFDVTRASFVEDHSLSVVLPVIPSTLASLDASLAPFLVPTAIIYEVAVVCPYSIVADVRRKLPDVLSNAAVGHPKVSLYPWSSPIHHDQAALQVSAQVKTPYVLFLDERGLDQITDCNRAYLLRPRAILLPVGPRGFTGSPHKWSQLLPSHRTQPAVFLVPPFVAPSSLLSRVLSASRSSLDWPLLGNFVAKLAFAPFGGIVIGTDISDPIRCNTAAEPTPSSLGRVFADDLDHLPFSDSPFFLASPNGFIVLAFPHLEHLWDFMPAACKLHHQGYTILAYIYDAESARGDIGSNCYVPFVERSKATPTFSDWFYSLRPVPDIVISLDQHDPVSSTLALISERSPFLNTTLMRLPRLELPYSEWIGTLTLDELRRWNIPEITISVITNNRPRSLWRLLNSIKHTLFYGDRVNIRINTDQTCDPETMRMVQDFEWLQGDVFLHHRVIHGGLLPAVVESWYPHCDDCYGLLLEDDIELSPLSYAWIKMALLRYKYGNSSSSKLFGISLYQQKVVELRPAGRELFNARTLFQSASLTDPSTPYLSQVPCSWGALYFPSPWREFHDYLSVRLSQSILPIESTIVSGLRSNRWTKSWKKYFIELVYLRGYVMLYPNYADFVSLSTNHLEVGSHVKDEPETVYEQKKHLFSLPLMPLSSALAGSVSGPRLLDLPGGTLPDWDRLPVLDLVGQLSSIETIEKRGEQRRSEMSNCLGVASLPSNVQDLLCHISV